MTQENQQTVNPADISSRARTCLLNECWSGVSIVMSNRIA